MNTYISILRGINVSGHRLIKMDALKNLYAELGFEQVKTYIQSGNVVFRHETSNPVVLAQRIENAIAEKFGFDVPVMVIESSVFERILTQNPFIADSTKDISHLHLTFLADTPNTDKFNGIKAEQYLPDEFRLLGSVIYLYCPNGYGNTKLNNTFFENKLSLRATTRNWKTSNVLHEMGEGMG